MVWTSESEGTNVVGNSPPQRSNVSLKTIHEGLVEEKEWKALRACRGQEPDPRRNACAKCKPLQGVCALGPPQDDVAGTR